MSTRRLLGAVCVLAFSLTAGGAFAQGSGSGSPSEKPPAPDKAVKDTQKKMDEIAEASQILSGAAGNPECVWLGRRVVSLLWRDDLDTAFRHLDLYDRFGCPGPHIQATFRCLVRQPNIDPKSPESLNGRIHSCWLDPELPASPTTAQAPDSQQQPGTEKQ